jgi:hypothetical protein
MIDIDLVKMVVPISDDDGLIFTITKTKTKVKVKTKTKTKVL